MIKIGWDNAPSWANWAAMDAGGDWYWYEFRPVRDDSIAVWVFGRANPWNTGRVQRAYPDIELPWRESLQKRPEK